MTGAGTQPPGAQGLYDPRHEHDACGVGFVVNVKGRRSHTVIEQGLRLLINLLHRGACGCEANTGRRRRHPDPDAGPVPAQGDRPARHPAARGRPVRCRARVPAAGSRRAPRDRVAGRRRSSRKRTSSCSGGARCRPTTACSARARWRRSRSSSSCSWAAASTSPSTPIRRRTGCASNASCTSPASASSTRSIASRWPRSTSSTWSASRRAR